MSQKNDFDFLKDKFDADGLSAPDSLSAEEMKKKLLEAEAAVQSEAADSKISKSADVIKKPQRRYVWGSIGAAAACIVAVMVIGNTVLSPLGGKFDSQLAEYGEMAAGATQDDVADDSADTAGATDGAAEGSGGKAVSPEDAGMISFSSYAELEGQVSSLVPEKEEWDGGGGIGLFSNGMYKDSDAVLEDAAEVPMDGGTMAESGDAAMAAGEGAGDASSDTYVQVQGVDEADIVKTDDKYIYFLDEFQESILIYEAENGEAELVGSLEVLADMPMIEDFYLYGDTLVTIGSEWDEKTDRTVTDAVIYDISDRTSPIKVNDYKQSGYLISSRMVEDQLYLVTDYSFYYYGGDRYIPYVTGPNGYDKMDINDICAFPDHLMPEYIIAGSVDVSSGKQLKTKAKAVLGGSQDIYCNTKNLYIAGYQYDYSGYDYGDVVEYALDDGTDISYGDVIEDAEADTDTAAPETLREGTRLLKLSLNDGAIRFVAGGMVEGYIDNQFSMDEKNGYLRIATTSRDAHGYDINNLFVLDENLSKVGEVTGFAKNEHVEAVRYIGEKAYVITYEQTDPLFVIDVSDPTKPQIEGSVKIDGFSTLLVPADENTLFGIGFATRLTQFGEAQDGLKLVAFDISNPSRPEVMDAEEYMNAYSEVQYNHKALVKNAKSDYYAIPYNQYDSDGYYFEHSGVLVVRIQNGKIKVLKDYQDTSDQIRRCVYIGDYIYTISYEDEVDSFQMK